MSQTRWPAVAGQFYPGDARSLRDVVEGYLTEARGRVEALTPKALIVPHAGYIYSGPVAASAYALLTPLRDVIRRVVLLGPSHFVPFEGLALPQAQAFATPLGEVPLELEVIERLRELPQVKILDAAHGEEHSLEVQLPFLQVVLGEFRLVPLAVGEARHEQMAEVLERLWGGVETLIVLSTDLSHYLSYSQAQAVDRRTSQAIEQLRPAAIGTQDACGCVPLRGLLHYASAHGLRVHPLDLRNSGDTAGGRDRVVGYGAYALTETPPINVPVLH